MKILTVEHSLSADNTSYWTDKKVYWIYYSYNNFKATFITRVETFRVNVFIELLTKRNL